MVTTNSTKKFKDQLSTLTNVSLDSVTKNGFYIRFRKGKSPNQINEMATVNNFKQAKILWSKFISENKNSMEPVLYSNEILSDYISKYFKNIENTGVRNDNDEETIRRKQRTLVSFSETFGHIKMSNLRKNLTKEMFLDYIFKNYGHLSKGVVINTTQIITKLFKSIIDDDNQFIFKHQISTISGSEINFGYKAKNRKYMLRDEGLEMYEDFKNKLSIYLEQTNDRPVYEIEKKYKNKTGTYKYQQSFSTDEGFYYGFMATTYLAIHTGMRISEIAGLRWSDLIELTNPNGNKSYRIIVQRQAIRSNKIKNNLKKKQKGETRTIFISKKNWNTIHQFRNLQTQMAKLKDMNDDFKYITSYPGRVPENPDDKSNRNLITGEFLFTRNRVHKFFPRPNSITFQQVMKSAYRKKLYEYFANIGGGIWNELGNEGIKFHLFRHGFAMQFIQDNKGNHKNLLKVIMGHSKDEDMEHYSRLAIQDGLLIDDAINTYEDLLYNQNI